MSATHIEALREAAADGVALDGLHVSFDGDAYVFETPEERHEDLSAEAFREAAAANHEYVSNWYVWSVPERTADRRAFLRWAEMADEHPVPERYEALHEGIERTWGELLVTVSLDEDDGRTYDLRHEDDADHDPTALDAHRDPLDARHLATEDEDGRYRPLKTAPSLRSGWVFPDLSGAELVRAVDFFYPATVANWHREREGELDVTHWQETAERQTGIYDIIDELHPEAVEWVAQTCCVDSQCLKRRQWDLNEDHELDAPRGDSEFPCREPCSLVVAAARKWTTLEREEAREYSFELTPSEKEQVEDIIDAVADGRTDEIREADVYEGANRYRTRFLRAKRFDEDGNLCGVKTED
ncbi:DR2241 family protein [Halomarina litorea]|uniref:DR2241 family protein n=1 Tax=Halomarina litorea TaxID=2961595 RepID=UPI0020C43502|nr:DR2241 family protein [Halomarina sp. BCD28]